MKLKCNLNFSYDEENDILTVEGLKFSGDYFRSLAYAELNRNFKIVERKDGVLKLQRISETDAKS